MFRRFRVALGLLAALVACAGVARAEGVLDLVPDQALGFAVTRQVDQADAKIGKLAESMGLPLPGMLPMLKNLAGVEQGLNPAGQAAVAVLPGKDKDAAPASVMLLPVSDYQAFLGQLKPEKVNEQITRVMIPRGVFLAAERQGYAVLASEDDQAALEQVLAAQTGVTAKVASLKDWIAANDVSLVVTRGGVQLAGEKAAQALAEMRKGFEQMRAQMNQNGGGTPGMAKEQLDAAAGAFQMYESFVQILREQIDTAGLGLRVDEQSGLHVTVPVSFVAESQVATALKSPTPAKADLLARLPSGPYVFAFGGVTPENLGDSMMRMSMDMFKFVPQFGQFTPEQIDEIVRESQAVMKAMTSMSFVVGVPEEGQPIYGNMIGVFTVDNASTYLDNYQQHIKKLARIAGPKSPLFGEMKSERIDVDGKAGLKMSMPYPTMPAPAQGPDMSKLMEKMYGPGGIAAYLVAVNDTTVGISYTSPQMIKASTATLTGAKPGLAAEVQVKKALAMLPQGAQWTGLWSPQGTVLFAQRLMEVTFTAMNEGGGMPGGPAQNPFERMPKMPDSPPIGLALQLGPARATFSLHVPAETLRTLVNYVGAVQQQMSAPPAAPPGGEFGQP